MFFRFGCVAVGLIQWGDCMALILFIGILFLILWICVFSYIKRLKYGNLTLISGGVKTGKTMLSVCLVLKQYKRQLRKWRRACRKAKRKYQPFPEKPLIYSNMPLKCEYSPLTLALITGKERFRYGSVVYFNEMSLIAGSKDIKSEILNDWLLRFFKLCAHETRGGYFIIDTQSPQDMHYTLKRSLSTYYFISKKIWFPFFNVIFLRENLLVDGENTVAVDTQTDPQDTVSEGGKKWYFRLIRHKWWKYYDQYAYSSLTDDLPVADEIIKGKPDSLKVRFLVRCKDVLKALQGGGKNA